MLRVVPVRLGGRSISVQLHVMERVCDDLTDVQMEMISRCVLALYSDLGRSRGIEKPFQQELVSGSPKHLSLGVCQARARRVQTQIVCRCGDLHSSPAPGSKTILFTRMAPSVAHDVIGLLHFITGAFVDRQMFIYSQLMVNNKELLQVADMNDEIQLQVLSVVRKVSKLKRYFKLGDTFDDGRVLVSKKAAWTAHLVEESMQPGSSSEAMVVPEQTQANVVVETMEVKTEVKPMEVKTEDLAAPVVALVPMSKRRRSDAEASDLDEYHILKVSRASDKTISRHISGVYDPFKRHQGSICYKKRKINGDWTEAYIFVCPSSGPHQDGWWIGPEIDGNHVWAHHATKVNKMPPFSLWNVPYDQEVDKKLQIHSLGISNIPRGSLGSVHSNSMWNSP
jgi:hypothetical protein